MQQKHVNTLLRCGSLKNLMNLFNMPLDLLKRLLNMQLVMKQLL